ncbi:LAFE_0E08372g1_1 [Lachancea fermentati]|uniref:LAFE_0E08372g1_1 n=1 Tax=Lachancea fermentati TaxID=4955 RepID=A0A1G4MDP4_LACFM|nr:LAFE_0E08372g1_1 [Lachancea fermentati]
MTKEIKKRRVEDSLLATKRKVPASKVFSPFRVVGNVSNGVPFAVGTLGSTFYIVTSVGKTFQIYDASNLHLLFISSQETETSITCLATHFHYVLAGFSNKVGIYRRGKVEHLIELPVKGIVVQHLCMFGDFLCASANNNTIYVYKKNAVNEKCPTSYYTELKVSSLQGGEIVSLIHLPTYLNKVIVVTKSNILLYNIRSGKLLFSSDEFPDQITAAEPAPVLDIVALGTVSGEIIMYNIRKGKKVRTIKMPAPVSSLSFRTDGSEHLAVGSTTGDLIFYDLERRTRIHILKNIHREAYGGVSKACFLNGQPIVVTTGNDNQLKEYVFDPSLSQNDSESVVQPPRFLRSRGGHSLPPTCIAFADSQSHFILSSSRDRSLWGFSLRKDAQSQELSQRLHKKKDGSRIGGSTNGEKFPEIITFSIENARQGEWENILTAHKDEKFARTWNSATKRVGRWTLATIDEGYAKCTAISPCGNFGFVGSSNGGIGVYNLQSGLPRKKYKLHKKAVSGIAVDGMNRKMVSCGLDGIIGFYDFSKSQYLGKLTLNAPITSLVYHRSSDLFAVALDDFSIVVIDAVTQKVVRQLWGHTNRISAFDFSPNGRWIVSTSLDSTIRTWDLPTGSCIDGVRLDCVATNLRFSPNGDLLATTHVNGNGIALWTNRAQFKSVPTKQVDESDFAHVLLPNSSGEGGASVLDGAFDDKDEDTSQNEIYGVYKSMNQINNDLITLSLGPRNKLNTLLNLDVIKQRSKPAEPPKKPEKAPFFLKIAGEKVGDDALVRENGPNAHGSSTTGAESEDKQLNAERELATFKPIGNVGFESSFTRLLREGHQSGSYSEFLENLVRLPPSSIDLEIKSLNSFEPFDEIVWFVEAISEGLSTNTNFELYEAYMSLLLKSHGDVIHANNKIPKIYEAFEKWNRNHCKENRLDELVKFCSGVINFISTS